MSSSTEIKFDIEGNPNKGINTIYDLEIRVFQSLNDFNSIYAQYLRCTPLPDYNRDEVINEIMNNNENKTNCYSSPSLSDVERSYKTLEHRISCYEKAFQYIKTTTPNTPIPPTNMADLENNYNQLLELRRELDIKTAEINQNKDSKFSEMKERYDSTIYIKILMTILLVSIVYYMFLHM
jgi:hypothetical protein